MTFQNFAAATASALLFPTDQAPGARVAVQMADRSRGSGAVLAARGKDGKVCCFALRTTRGVVRVQTKNLGKVIDLGRNAIDSQPVTDEEIAEAEVLLWVDCEQIPVVG